MPEPQSVAAQYDIEATPEAEAQTPASQGEATPAAGETPAAPTTPVARPRDEHGRFVKSDPSAVATEEAPSNPAPSSAPYVPAYLRRHALDIGMSDDEIISTPPDVLHQVVMQSLRDRAELLRQHGIQGTLQGDIKQPHTPEPEAPPDYGLSRDQMDAINPDIFKAIESSRKETSALKREIQELKNALAVQRQETIGERVDRAFEKHSAILGEGRGRDLEAGSAEMARRRAILGIVDGMKTGTLEQRIDRAVGMLFGQQQKAVPTPQGSHTVPPDQWNQGATVKPTNRIAKLPNGDKKAVASVSELLGQMDQGESTTSEDDFLPGPGQG